MKEWQVIFDIAPGLGAWNMAVDEYLFQSLPDSPSTYIRFYSWERPTVSLGYSQDIGKVVDVDYCNTNGIDIVRRVTGGKLVLHDKEVTYSVCSSDTGLFSSTLSGSYRLISEGLIAGLAKMGLDASLADAPPLAYTRGNLPCFSYPARNEIEVDGKKMVGSAQKRVGDKFLQHGSIPLEKESQVLSRVSNLEQKEERIRMISLSEALGHPIEFKDVVLCLMDGMAEYFRVSLHHKIFTDNEIKAIKHIEAEKHTLY